MIDPASHPLSDPLLGGATLSVCDEYPPEALYDLLDDVLPAASPERSELIDHLCSCRACQLELRAARGLDTSPGTESASTASLLEAVHDAARRELVVLLRELFSAWLLAADRSGRVLCEQQPRGLPELDEQLVSLVRRLRALGEPVDLGDPGDLAGLGDLTCLGAHDGAGSTAAAAGSLAAQIAPERRARAAARAVLTHLDRLGDERWVALGVGLLDGVREVDDTCVPEFAGDPLGLDEPGPIVRTALPTLPADTAVDRALRLRYAVRALRLGQTHAALALVADVLAVRADDLAALAVRLAARGRQADARAFRLAARRFGATEQRHPNRVLRDWARDNLQAWARDLGQTPALVASWLQQSAGRVPGRSARACAPPFVLPAPHGRAWAPGALCDTLDGALGDPLDIH